MLVELSLLGGCFGLGAGIGLLWRRAAKAAQKRTIAGRASRAAPRDPESLELNDVLLVEQHEYWLAGMVKLLDDPQPLCLFAAPHAGSHAWLMPPRRKGEGPALLFTKPTQTSSRAPDAFVVDGVEYRLDRRAFARTQSFGELPTLSDRVRFSLYRGPTDAVALILEPENGETLTLVGEWLRPGTFDHLPAKEPDRT